MAPNPGLSIAWRPGLGSGRGEDHAVTLATQTLESKVVSVYTIYYILLYSTVLYCTAPYYTILSLAKVHFRRPGSSFANFGTGKEMLQLPWPAGFRCVRMPENSNLAGPCIHFITSFGLKGPSAWVLLLTVWLYVGIRKAMIPNRCAQNSCRGLCAQGLGWRLK